MADLFELLEAQQKFYETPEGKVALEKHIEDFFREKTGVNGRCIDQSCAGRIVKRVHGVTSFAYIYSIPYCEKCAREYPFTDTSVPVVGHAEFERLMNTQYGL